MLFTLFPLVHSFWQSLPFSIFYVIVYNKYFYKFLSTNNYLSTIYANVLLFVFKYLWLDVYVYDVYDTSWIESKRLSRVTYYITSRFKNN